MSAVSRKQRWLTFFASVLLHGAAFSMVARHASRGDERSDLRPRYSLTLTPLQMPEYRAREERKPPSAARLKEAPTPPKSEIAAPLPEPRANPEPRRFQLPPRTKATPVTQTLVLDTVPPDTATPIQAPLPTLLLWTPPSCVPRRSSFPRRAPTRSHRCNRVCLRPRCSNRRIGKSCLEPSIWRPRLSTIFRA